MYVRNYIISSNVLQDYKKIYLLFLHNDLIFGSYFNVHLKQIFLSYQIMKLQVYIQ